MIENDGLLSNRIIEKLPVYFHMFGSNFNEIFKQIPSNNGKIWNRKEVLDLLRMRFQYAGSIQETLRRALHRQSDDRINRYGDDLAWNRPFHNIFGEYFIDIFFDPSAKELRFPEIMPLTSDDYSNKKAYRTAKKNILLRDKHHERACSIQEWLRLYLLGNNAKRSTDEFKTICQSLYRYSLLYGKDSVLDTDIQDFIAKRYLFNGKNERQIPWRIILERHYHNKGLIQHPWWFWILNKTPVWKLLSTSEYEARYLESVQLMFIKLREELNEIQVTPWNHSYFNFIIEEVENHAFMILWYQFKLFTCYRRDKDHNARWWSDDKKSFLNFLNNGGRFSKEMWWVTENLSFTKYRLHKKVNNEPELVTIESFIQSLLDLVISISTLVSKEWNSYEYLGKSSTSPHVAMDNFLQRHFPFVVREVLLDSHY
jgi:hypothetical protein